MLRKISGGIQIKLFESPCIEDLVPARPSKAQRRHNKGIDKDFYMRHPARAVFAAAIAATLLAGCGGGGSRLCENSFRK